MSVSEFADLIDSMADSSDRVFSELEEVASTASDGPLSNRFGSQRDIAKVVVFLRSDYEYEWPVTPRWAATRYLLYLLSFGYVRIGEEEMARWEQTGEDEAWPFLTVRDLKNAAEIPPFRPLLRAKAG